MYRYFRQPTILAIMCYTQAFFVGKIYTLKINNYGKLFY